ncbi:MAG: dienelactone hydrolase family protein, partial [Burkholderiales bacterium]
MTTSHLPQIKLGLALLFALAAHSATGQGQQSINLISSADGKTIAANLFKPDGPGPFPAMVIMHDCSGLGPRASGAPGRWAKLLQEDYVVILPDSFRSRGIDNGVCMIYDSAIHRSVNGAVRAADAYAALAALRELPYVDARAIGIMGGSHGGWATLATIVAPGERRDPLAEAKRQGFAAAIALYPSCQVQYGDWTPKRANGNSGPMISHSGFYRTLAPTLILTGEKDDWTPAQPCQTMVEASRAQGQSIDIKVYAGAHHAFDNDAPVRFIASRNNSNSPTGR